MDKELKEQEMPKKAPQEEFDVAEEVTDTPNKPNRAFTMEDFQIQMATAQLQLKEREIRLKERELTLKDKELDILDAHNKRRAEVDLEIAKIYNEKKA